MSKTYLKNWLKFVLLMIAVAFFITLTLVLNYFLSKALEDIISLIASGILSLVLSYLIFPAYFRYFSAIDTPETPEESSRFDVYDLIGLIAPFLLIAIFLGFMFFGDSSVEAQKDLQKMILGFGFFLALILTGLFFQKYSQDRSRRLLKNFAVGNGLSLKEYAVHYLKNGSYKGEAFGRIGGLDVAIFLGANPGYNVISVNGTDSEGRLLVCYKDFFLHPPDFRIPTPKMPIFSESLLKASDLKESTIGDKSFTKRFYVSSSEGYADVVLSKDLRDRMKKEMISMYVGENKLVLAWFLRLKSKEDLQSRFQYALEVAGSLKKNLKGP